jgi:hypothetical protein
MSAKAVASLSSGLLKRGTRQRNAGFVLSTPVESDLPAAATEEAEAGGRAETEAGLTVRMRSTGGEVWSPDGAGEVAEQGGKGARSADYCDGSLEALSRRIGPLVSEYLGSATVGEPAPETSDAAEATEQASDAAEPTAEEPPSSTDAQHRRAGKAPAEGQGAGRADDQVAPEESAGLPTVEGRESLVIDMVQAFRGGDRMLGEELFGVLTGLAPEEVSRLLYHGSGEVLAATCRALSMDQLHFVSLFVLTRKGTLSRHAVDLRDLGKIVDYFNGLNREAGARLFATWRRTAWQ